MTTADVKFSDRVKEWRKKMDLSQEQAARAFPVSVSTYQNWEQGRAVPVSNSLRWAERVLNRCFAQDELSQEEDEIFRALIQEKAGLEKFDLMCLRSCADGWDAITYQYCDDRNSTYFVIFLIDPSEYDREGLEEFAETFKEGWQKESHEGCPPLMILPPVFVTMREIILRKTGQR